ncbi:MAG: alpha/beta hydrolase [Flavobacteriaceae bacterium]
MDLLSQQKKLTPSLVIPKPVVVFSKVLGAISPSLAIRLAAKIFTTPIRFKTPQRELVMESSAQKKKLTVKEIRKEIHVLSYGYSKRKVLLVHGWAGRSTQLFSFADKLLEKGFMVISFDGPAHSKSSGKTTNMVEFLTTIKKIDQEYGPFEAAIGHSFGGMCLYNAVAKFLSINALVTIGSGDKVTNILKLFVKNLGHKEELHPKLQSYLEKKWQVKVVDFDSSQMVKKITIPTMIIHDTDDGDVPVRYAHEIRQNSQSGNILITHGLGHTKILRDKGIVNRTVNFIIQNT